MGTPRHEEEDFDATVPQLPTVTVTAGGAVRTSPLPSPSKSSREGGRVRWAEADRPAADRLQVDIAQTHSESDSAGSHRCPSGYPRSPRATPAAEPPSGEALLEYQRLVCRAVGGHKVVTADAFSRVLQVETAPWAMLGRMDRLGNLLYDTVMRRQPGDTLTCEGCARALWVLCQGDRHHRLQLGFDICDRNGDGLIDPEDVLGLVTHFELVMDSTSDSRRAGSYEKIKEQADKIFKSLDRRRQGRVTFQQYCEAVEANAAVLGTLALREGRRFRTVSAGNAPEAACRRHQTAMLAIMAGLRRQGVSGARPEGSKFIEHEQREFARIRELSSVTDEMLRSSLGMEGLLGGLLLGHLGTFKVRMSEAQSGCAFLESHDKRFLLKEVKDKEKDVLLSIVKDYCKHLERNRSSLLCRYLGLYSVDCGNGLQHFGVMPNMFHPWTDGVHRRFDLKGSNFRRTRLPSGMRIEDPRAPTQLLDDDVRSARKTFPLGPKRGCLLEQVRKDTTFLSSHNLYDYSFLIGEGQGAPGATNTTLTAASTVLETAAAAARQRRPSSLESPRAAAASQRLHVHSGEWDDREERGASFFASVTVQRPGVLLFMGIIDFLERYTLRRGMERAVKRLASGGRDPTATNPTRYATRLCTFLGEILTE
eukprot:TRINITY_DN14668_c0_g1_i1.p1 TRINITY_DN14668_c0_g1~~TRINITY_DN14668_c0_g1_i1.p1  ORF type:complete len:650 (+),score=166.31 TRINITY_DN14668_c0_g1_i1:128-2077(+)